MENYICTVEDAVDFIEDIAQNGDEVAPLRDDLVMSVNMIGSHATLGRLYTHVALCKNGEILKIIADRITKLNA